MPLDSWDVSSFVEPEAELSPHVQDDAKRCCGTSLRESSDYSAQVIDYPAQVIGYLKDFISSEAVDANPVGTSDGIGANDSQNNHTYNPGQVILYFAHNELNVYDLCTVAGLKCVPKADSAAHNAIIFNYAAHLVNEYEHLSTTHNSARISSYTFSYSFYPTLMGESGYNKNSVVHSSSSTNKHVKRADKYFIPIPAISGVDTDSLIVVSKSKDRQGADIIFYCCSGAESIDNEGLKAINAIRRWIIETERIKQVFK